MSIHLEGVSIRYGERVAVDHISTVIPRGAVGLVGRNGAGKSSILKALLGLVKPTAGRMWIDGEAGREGRDGRLGAVGYMPERDAHVPAATGFEMVRLLGRLSGMARRDAWRRAHEVLYLVGLDDQRYRAIGTYSAGMRQRVKLAAALVDDPAILLLDEPTNGLDPDARGVMLDLVRRLARELGKSIVLSTHILQDVERVCDAAVVLERGRIVAQGTIAALTAGGARELALWIEPSELELPQQLANGMRLRTEGAGHYTVHLDANVDTASLLAVIAAGGGRVRRLAPRRRSLEEVFLSTVVARSPAEKP
jgi:ABC-2 type transport system ATP-binding protein